MEKIKLVLAQMTPVQRRRYRRYLKGWSLTKIAGVEDVSIQSVQESIFLAKKKVKKRLGHLKST